MTFPLGRKEHSLRGVLDPETVTSNACEETDPQSHSPLLRVSQQKVIEAGFKPRLVSVPRVKICHHASSWSPRLHPLSSTSSPQVPPASLLDPAPQNQAAREPLVSPPSDQSSFQRWKPRPPRQPGRPLNKGHRPRAGKAQATPGKARCPPQTLIIPEEPSQARTRRLLPAALASARRGEKKSSALCQLPKHPPAPPKPTWGQWGAAAAQEGPIPSFLSQRWIPRLRGAGGGVLAPWLAEGKKVPACPTSTRGTSLRVHFALSVLCYDGQRWPPKCSGFPHSLQAKPCLGPPCPAGVEKAN